MVGVRMNKKEIKYYIERMYDLGTKLTGEDKETYTWLIYGYNQCAKLLNKTEEQCKKQKEVIDKLKEFIESKNNGVCVINGKEKEAFTFLLDFDKAREFIWGLLDILKEVE